MPSRSRKPPSRKRPSQRPPRSEGRAVLATLKRGYDVGRGWGGSAASPAEIDRISEALRDSKVFETDPALGATPEVQGALVLARLAFLIRPELLAERGADLEVAMAAGVDFWKGVLGENYRAVEFADTFEAVLWLRGFAEGAIHGYMGLGA